MFRLQLLVALFVLTLASCHTTKKINSAIAPRDTTVARPDSHAADSLAMVNNARAALKDHYINFNTFSAKIKVEIEDAKGKQPDITAVVRIIKDSAIWMSLSATFLNIEVYRVLITKQNVILLNKQAKEVQYRTLDYLQDVTHIPFDFKTVQDLLIGNPVFFNEQNATFRKLENFLLISSVGEDFKNLLTLNADNGQLLHSKLDDVDLAHNRTADITYADYINTYGHWFATSRQVIVTEKNKLDIRMDFKQIEFNKELSVAFTIPKNYKKN